MYIYFFGCVCCVSCVSLCTFLVHMKNTVHTALKSQHSILDYIKHALQIWYSLVLRFQHRSHLAERRYQLLFFFSDTHIYMFSFFLLFLSHFFADFCNLNENDTTLLLYTHSMTSLYRSSTYTRSIWLT